MDPDEMAETVMSKNTRTLKQISMEDAEEVAKTFMNLMGESVGPRKSFTNIIPQIMVQKMVDQD